MEYCKYMKLTNGENIIVTTDNDCKQFKQHKTINIVNPVELAVLRVTNGPMVMESMTLQPWIKVAPNDVIEVPTESILLVTDVKEEAIEQYKTFLVEYQNLLEQRKNQEQQVDQNDLDFLDDMFEELHQTEDDHDQEIDYEYKTIKRTIH